MHAFNEFIQDKIRVYIEKNRDYAHMQHVLIDIYRGIVCVATVRKEERKKKKKQTKNKTRDTNEKTSSKKSLSLSV